MSASFYNTITKLFNSFMSQNERLKLDIFIEFNDINKIIIIKFKFKLGGI